MKKLLLAAALALGATQAQAAPCSTTTLLAYIGLGAGGCEIGMTTASNFQSLDIPFGAIPIAPANILVVPQMTGPLSFGFDFQVNRSAGPNEFFDFVVSYLLAGQSLTGAAVLLQGAAATGDGVVTAITDLCRNGLFPGGIGTCTGDAAGPLIAFQTALDQMLIDQQTFPPTAALAVITDVGIDGGLAGSATLASAGNRFNTAPSVVPVPAPLALLVIGLAALGFSRRHAQGALQS